MSNNPNPLEHSLELAADELINFKLNVGTQRGNRNINDPNLANSKFNQNSLILSYDDRQLRKLK
jgi:hypothetical protein